MTALPTGTVTFLFTDLEGSTRRWEEQPNAMRGALARHDEILRDAVESHHGHVVKTTGDGLHAVFDTAEDAIGAAAGAQVALRDERWEPSDLIRVRMGLHTGSAELRGGDYYGPAVNRAARLAAAAHGGQILVSHATEEVVRDSLPPMFGLIDLGEHRLRDLSRPEHVFQLVAPGLRDEFPPIDSLDAFPGNLPVQRTSFVGRDEDVASIVAALEQGRLVTLTGVGGVGKTRLALHVAADLLPDLRHGAWFCELAAITDEASVVELVGSALRIQPAQGVALDVGLLEFLHDRELLLVLDNCEHVLDAVSRFADSVLARCRRVRILATSREPIGIDGEQVWPVTTLSVGSADRDASNHALQLFWDRARAVNPRLRVDDESEAAVTEICRRLDGIPLAIELSAARVVSMSPQDIAARLDERFRLLTGRRRGESERHQTLAATVDWSFQLLDSTEQRVFERLSIFAGSFDAATAEAVVSGDGIEGWDVVEALSSLVVKSMVGATHPVAGDTRYELLETLRAYGRDRLGADQDPDQWHRRLVEHLVGLVEDHWFELRGVNEDYWADRLLLEFDNVRSCLAWSLTRPDDDDVALGLRMVASLARLGTFGYGYAAASVGGWAQRAAGKTALLDSGRASMVLGTAAWSAIRQGDATAARQFAEEAMRYAADGVGPGAAEVPFTAMSMVEAVSGNPTRALEISQHGRRVLEEAGANPSTILTLHSVAAAWAAAAGAKEAARAEADQAVAMARELGSPSLLATALFTLGLALEFDDASAALAAFEESVALVRGRNTTLILARTLAAVAQARARVGDVPGALRVLREALEVSQDGQRSEIAATIDRGIDVLARAGARERAAVFAGIATRGPLSDVNTLMGSAVAARREQALRESLGDAAFEGAAGRGAAMSYDEVIDYTTGALDDTIAALDAD